MKKLFITGTDTDCGKTYVMTELLRLAAQQQRSVIGLKPVASGCYFDNGELVSDDALQIQKYNSSPLAICHWKFLPPIAPHIAAAKAGQRLTSKTISHFCAASPFNQYDVKLIEGAGGLMAPLNEAETWIDLVKRDKLSIILVVGMRLGCLNHALLTDAAIRQQQLPCLGWIANCIDGNMLALEENIATLQQQMSMPHLATISYQGHLAEDTWQKI